MLEVLSAPMASSVAAGRDIRPVTIVPRSRDDLLVVYKDPHLNVSGITVSIF